MLSDAREILRQLNSPLDVVIVGSAGLAGFVLDAAINIVPLPIFSPGVCGVTFAGAALTAKKGWDAQRSFSKQKQLLALTQLEARRTIARLREAGEEIIAQQLEFELERSNITKDHAELAAAIRATSAVAAPAIAKHPAGD